MRILCTIRDFCYHFLIIYGKDKNPDGFPILFGSILFPYYIGILFSLMLLFEQYIFSFHTLLKQNILITGVLFTIIMFAPFIYLLKPLLKKLEIIEIKKMTKKEVLYKGIFSLFIFIFGFGFMIGLLILTSSCN